MKVKVIKGTPTTRKVILWDGANELTVDEITGSLATISTAHHEIHEGEMFSCIVNDGDLDAAQILSMAFKTGTTKHNHILFVVDSTGGCYYELLEGPTITASTGTQIDVFNRKRSSAHESTVLEESTGSLVANKAVKNPTIAADGTVFWRSQLGQGKNKQGGSSRAMDEWILKQDTWYAVRVTSEENDNVVNATCIWYEESDN